MLYVDYHFDLSENGIILDEDLRLSSQEKDKPWGTLPSNWKEGDLFTLMISPSGKVVLRRKPDDE